MKKTVMMLLGCALLWVHKAEAQEFAVKTNLLYDATTTLNLGLEVGIGHHMTIDLSGNYNPWEFDAGKKIRHWLVQPELRYWTCEKFRKHFFGIHAFGGEFNAGGVNLPFGGGALKDHRYYGHLYGGGVSYGYHWMLGGRWGLEATIGAGYARVYYKEYALPKCSPRLAERNKNYWGITKVGLTLVFMIK